MGKTKTVQYRSQGLSIFLFLFPNFFEFKSWDFGEQKRASDSGLHSSIEIPHKRNVTSLRPSELIPRE